MAKHTGSMHKLFHLSILEVQAASNLIKTGVGLALYDPFAVFGTLNFSPFTTSRKCYQSASLVKLVDTDKCHQFNTPMESCMTN